MIDLNSLLDASGLGWRLTEAWGINDAGQIVGTGCIDTSEVCRAVLLTPQALVPEPSTLLLLLGSGLGGLGGFAWRQKHRG